MFNDQRQAIDLFLVPNEGILRLDLELGTDFSESLDVSIPNIDFDGESLDLVGAADLSASGSITTKSLRVVDTPSSMK